MKKNFISLRAMIVKGLHITLVDSGLNVAKGDLVVMKDIRKNKRVIQLLVEL